MQQASGPVFIRSDKHETSNRRGLQKEAQLQAQLHAPHTAVFHASYWSSAATEARRGSLDMVDARKHRQHSLAAAAGAAAAVALAMGHHVQRVPPAAVCGVAAAAASVCA